MPEVRARGRPGRDRVADRARRSHRRRLTSRPRRRLRPAPPVRRELARGLRVADPRGRPDRPARARRRLRHGALPRRSSPRRAKAWGVDPARRRCSRSPAHAPARAGLKLGSAEELPFKDGWFERAVDVARRPPGRPAARVRRAPRVLAPDGRLRGRHLRSVLLRRLLAERALPVDGGDRPRALPDRGGARGRASAAGFDEVRLDAPLARAARSTAQTRSSGSAASTSRPST